MHKQAVGITVKGCPPTGDLSYSKLKEKFIFGKFDKRWEKASEYRCALDCRPSPGLFLYI